MRRWPRASRRHATATGPRSPLTGSERIDAYLAGLLAELRLAFAVMDDPRALHEPFLRRNRRIADLLTADRTDRAEAELVRYLDDAQELIVARMRQDAR
jgi:hypothetical protein